MTFGQTLNQILTIADMRASTLAEELGYDSSYISRWLSGQKLPSLKYNDDLFKKIAASVVRNMADENIPVLVSTLLPHADTDTDKQKLTNELSLVLSNSFYSSGVSITKKYMMRSDSSNASLSVLPQKMVFQLFYDAIAYLSKTSSRPFINMIVNAPPHLHANEEFSVITNIPKGAGIKPIIIHQTLNLNDFAQHAEQYSARLFQFFSCSPNVYYQLYETDDRPSSDNLFIVIEDGLLYYYLNNPYGGQSYSLYSFDKDLIFEHYSSTEANLGVRPRLTSYCSYSGFAEKHLLYRYLIAGRVSMLLNVMYPAIMLPEMYKELVEKYAAESENRFHLGSQYAKLWQASKHIILFRSALVRYICDGEMDIYGKIVSVDEATRKAHLSFMLDTLKNSSEYSFMILEDDNPYISANDCGASLFLSDGIAFMANSHGDEEHQFIRFRGRRILECLYSFFDVLQNSNEKFMIKNELAIRFLERVLDMISNTSQF